MPAAAAEGSSHVTKGPAPERIDPGARAQHLAITIGGRAMVASTAAVLAAYISDDNLEGAYRQLIQISDDLVAVDPATAVVLAYAPPRSAAPEWDAAIAGVTEYRLNQKGAPLPAWLAEIGPVDKLWEPLPRRYEWLSLRPPLA